MKRILAGILLVCAVAEAQQTIYWKKDHIYANGKEVAVLMPAPTDQTAPNAPTALAASAVVASSVHLNWTGTTDNTGGSGLAGYKIYRGNLPVATVAAPPFDDYTLKASTTYTYTVVAFD